MFRRAANTFRTRIYGRYIASNSKRSQDARVPSIVLLSAIVATSMALPSSTVHNDGPPRAPQKPGKDEPADNARQVQVVETDTLNTLVWGSNRSLLLDPNATSPFIPRPTVASWLKNVALRDLGLHERHAACVDARGDVYQWGEGFFGSEQASVDLQPTLTLRGKNIISLQLTPSRVFALSASGKVYVLASEATKQALSTGKPTLASTPWWRMGWGEEPGVDCAEITPTCGLAWGEKFVSIASGNHHLLALTSKGRTFVYPINKQANDYGQLGMRKIELPEPFPQSQLATQPARRPVELIPRSTVDPYANASPYNRTPAAVSTPPSSTNDLSEIDDSSIRFCDRLFEIPSLRGVEVAQIAAGGRSSFARTSTGRVLGWGANEYGQIGIGNAARPDAVIVPTEVVLWQYTSARSTSRCLNVAAGGDLTCFTVERRDEIDEAMTDVLMCGNGQYGGLGNNQYSNGQGVPVRAKNISGLQQYDEAAQRLRPVTPYSVTISATGHVLLVLETSESGVGGRDLMAWGRNHEFELGNGKRGSSALPLTLSSSDDEQRIMLRARTASEVVDVKGKLWKRGVRVEQQAVAGYGNSVVYWRLC